MARKKPNRTLEAAAIGAAVVERELDFKFSTAERTIWDAGFMAGAQYATERCEREHKAAAAVETIALEAAMTCPACEEHYDKLGDCGWCVHCCMRRCDHDVEISAEHDCFGEAEVRTQ